MIELENKNQSLEDLYNEEETFHLNFVGSEITLCGEKKGKVVLTSRVDSPAWKEFLTRQTCEAELYRQVYFNA